jgi:hypothetical protein
MTPLTISLNYDRPTALLQPDAHGQPRQIALVIDWEHKTITVETRDPSDNGAPDRWWRGLADAYQLPPLVDATQLREWVETEVLPRAAPLAEAYRTVWEDIEQFGRFPGREQEKGDFDAWMDRAEPPTHDGGLWTVTDWLAGGVEEVLETTSDEDLRRLSQEIVDEAAGENVVLIGGGEAVLAHLIKVRLQRQEDASRSPDRYEIEGYEVLERVPRAYSRQSSATLYLPLEWANKRVKVVRLE